MNRYWVSWLCESEDYRPINYPPNERILGWWCTGSDSKDRATLVAVVKASTEESARDFIFADWPEAEATTTSEGWRFFNLIDKPNWRPGDRFPLDDWMEGRFDGRD